MEVGREYIFNDISAGVFQEFDVIKINKYKSKQERTVGIDLYNLYNDLPKNKNQNSKEIFLKHRFIEYILWRYQKSSQKNKRYY